MLIDYSPAIRADFSTACMALLKLEGVQNLASSPTLQADYAAAQAEVKAALEGIALSDLPSIQAWRSAFRRFGVEPTQYRCAIESLLRRLTKKGDIPSINTLVDLGNLISIRHQLPCAVIDLGAVSGKLRVDYAEGDELFTDLHAEGDAGVVQGEVIFVDEARRVHARRWCWRQSAQSAATQSSTSVLICIEAMHPDGAIVARQAQAQLHALLAEYAPCTVEMGFLSAT